MIFKGCITTKDFLLQRNVDWDSVRSLCTWESALLLFSQCPFSKNIWASLIQKLFLPVVPCDSPFDMLLSIIHGLDPQSKDLQCLGKLILPTYAWHVWKERNSTIFNQNLLNIQLSGMKLWRRFEAGLYFWGYRCLSSFKVNGTYHHVVHQYGNRRYLIH